MEKFISAICAFVMLCLGTLTSCAQNQEKKGESDMAQNKKALVVFFSHPGENYAVGNIEVGNTKIVADYISEITGADQFEIVCEKDYAMPYDDLTELAKDEQLNGELPAFKGEPQNLDRYDVVFVGGPVWWGTYPQVMHTFFKNVDLSGKTIIPFTTHEGSGLASCVDDIKKAYPNAKVEHPLSIYGHEVRTRRDKVEQWLNEIK